MNLKDLVWCDPQYAKEFDIVKLWFLIEISFVKPWHSHKPTTKAIVQHWQTLEDLSKVLND